MLTKLSFGKLFFDENKTQFIGEGTVIIEYEVTKGFPIHQTTLIMEGDWFKLGTKPDLPYTLELDGKISRTVFLGRGCKDIMQTWFNITFKPQNKPLEIREWYKYLLVEP